MLQGKISTTYQILIKLGVDIHGPQMKMIPKVIEPIYLSANATSVHNFPSPMKIRAGYLDITCGYSWSPGDLS